MLHPNELGRIGYGRGYNSSEGHAAERLRWAPPLHLASALRQGNSVIKRYVHKLAEVSRAFDLQATTCYRFLRPEADNDPLTGVAALIWRNAWGASPCL
jgi:hypothetical protein